MTKPKLGREDYPLAEQRPDLVAGRRGIGIGEITLEAVAAGRIEMVDLAITPEALRHQAQIARAAGRAALARNFERAAELALVPQAMLMETYELLRPGRARDKAALLAAAEKLRSAYGAKEVARFVEEAAEVYDRRDLFTFRF